MSRLAPGEYRIAIVVPKTDDPDARPLCRLEAKVSGECGVRATAGGELRVAEEARIADVFASQMWQLAGLILIRDKDEQKLDEFIEELRSV